MVNVIIPCAGEGKRFKEAGYDLPKPLINVLGDPLICRVIEKLDAENIYIVYQQSFDKYLFRHILKKRFPKLNFIPLAFNTRGPAETVLCGLNKINSDDPVLVVDCDTIYQENIVGKAGEDTIFYFNDPHPFPIYSYIKIEGFVTEIKEKQKISDNACTGAYSFKSGATLKRYCEEVLNKGEKSAGEFYISNVYDRMIRDGHKISASEVKEFHCLGTPVQLQTYCINEQPEQKRICFDLDNTLVTYPEVAGDYSTVLPIEKNIKTLRHLYEQGHTIIISTARRMKSSGNNPGKALKNGYRVLFNTLEKYNIPFHEIYLKPQADFYIDDLSCKPYNIEKETGFYFDRIDPRRFNKIRYNKDKVIKTTSNPGEIYWYQNIPEGIKDYFPEAVISGNEICMEKINGVSFSYLLVNNSLTKGNIDLLVKTIIEISNSESAAFKPIDYDKKIKDRYKSFDYSQIDPDAEEYLMILTGNFHEQIPAVIHGDLVFSNIFLCDNGLKFIDMRGMVGDEKTIYGDLYYDWAKVYQSLLGYDFILNDVEINEPYLRELRKYYEEYFDCNELRIIKEVAAGLLFSLIPLHDDIEKQKKYFNLIKCINL